MRARLKKTEAVETPSERFVAVIGDMVRSRELTRAQRKSIQIKFSEMIGRFNRVFAKGLKAKFAITLGDEFEGLIKAAHAPAFLPELMWMTENEFQDPALRVGIGFGQIFTEGARYAPQLDGPAFHEARRAIGISAKKKRLGGVFSGFGERDDAILSGFAGVLYHQRSHWSPQQRKMALLLHHGMTQTEAARRMGLTKQAISTYARAAGWSAYAEGETGWQAAIEEAIRRTG